jgi:hypothetical protein
MSSDKRRSEVCRTRAELLRVPAHTETTLLARRAMQSLGGVNRRLRQDAAVTPPSRLGTGRPLEVSSSSTENLAAADGPAFTKS